MQKIVSLVDKGPTSSKHDDDLADRLNSRYTVLFLVLFTIAVSAQLYVGTPITCWAPKEFGGGWIKYTNSYCWVKNTYYLPLEDEIPGVRSGERVKREILYYQWLPFIMLIQALFFYVPSAVWHGLNQKAGVDCDSILGAANKYQNTQKEDGRKRLLGLIVNQMDRFLLSGPDAEKGGGEMKIRGFVKKVFCVCCSTANGKYLIILYLFSKVLYVANVIVQFFMLNAVLKSDYSFYGYDLIHNVMNDKHWVNSESFPRVTMCDFTVRKLGNLHTYTVQCVLPINMYTEKIYAFLWVWMLFVVIVSALSFVQWLLRSVFTQDKYRYIRRHLGHSNTLIEAYPDAKEAKHAVQEFTDEYLKQDGMFMLRLIGHNTNNMTVTDIIKAVWQNWLKKHKRNDLDDSDYKPPLPTSSVDEPDGEKH